MREFVLLDAGPLGNACRRPGAPGADQYRLWIDALLMPASKWLCRRSRITKCVGS